MMSTAVATSTRNGRWGEKLLIAAIAPGAFAAAILSMGLTLEYFHWQPSFGPFEDVVAYAAMSTPLLVTLGIGTLMGGVLVALFVPGRPQYKWGLLTVGTLAWWAADYWLHVPGLIQLP